MNVRLFLLVLEAVHVSDPTELREVARILVKRLSSTPKIRFLNMFIYIK